MASRGRNFLTGHDVDNERRVGWRTGRNNRERRVCSHVGRELKTVDARRKRQCPSGRNAPVRRKPLDIGTNACAGRRILQAVSGRRSNLDDTGWVPEVRIAIGPPTSGTPVLPALPPPRSGSDRDVLQRINNQRVFARVRDRRKPLQQLGLLAEASGTAPLR